MPTTTTPTAQSTATVRVSMWNAKGLLQTKERTFKTESAMTTWLDQLAEAGNLHEVLAFGDQW